MKTTHRMGRIICKQLVAVTLSLLAFGLVSAASAEVRAHWNLDETAGTIAVEGRPFKDAMDDVHIYSNSLTQADIKNLVDHPSARDPRPFDLSVDVSPEVILNWSAGSLAAKTNGYDVYFGDNFADVNNATTSVPLGVYKGRQTATAYDPNLDFSKTYYWRIDEVNTANPDSPWKGPVWKFTTAAYLIVDDFEAYPDKPFPIPVVASGVLEDFEAYADDNAPRPLWWPVTDCVYIWPPLTIRKWMEFRFTLHYLNPCDFSEVEGKYTTAQDWTRLGVKALVLYFRGSLTNSIVPMYIALEDVAGRRAAVYYDGDPDNLRRPDWTEWNMRLQDFNDINNVDLKNVKKICIGFGDKHHNQPGGTGMVCFDNIRLYPPRCRPELKLNHGDLNGDCVTDAADLGIMQRDWLLCDYSATMMAWYKFDETTGAIAHDSAGFYNATVSTDSAWDIINTRKCLHFDGTLGVTVPPVMFTGLQQITISLWLYGLNQPSAEEFILTGQGHDSTDYAAIVKCPALDGSVFWLCDTTSLDWITDTLLWSTAKSSDWNNKWNHYAFTKDARPGVTTMKIFCNGQQKAVKTNAAHPIGGWKQFIIGRSLEDDQGKYHGYMADFRIYDRALTEPEVASIMDGSEGIVPAGYYPLLSPANIYDKEQPLSKAVNMKDFTVIMDTWLQQKLWP